MPGVYTTLLNKYYVDELYDRLFVEPTKQLGKVCDWFDRTIIDGLVRSIDRGTDAGSAAITWTEKHVIYAGLNIIGYANHLLARSWRRLQTGMVHQYAAIIVAGLFILVHIVLLIWTGAGSTGYSSR
jgi:NADH-quinone oxidoreductase subunit L